MSDYPLVTVCHLCYNNAEYICEAINAVRETNYPNIQHFVIDDASRPEQVDVLRGFLEKIDASDINLIVHETNRGIPASQNHAVELARGKYFIGSISDDLMIPSRIESDVDCLEESNGNVVGLFAIAEIFHAKIGDGNGHFMGLLEGFSPGINHTLSSSQLRDMLLKKNFIPAPTVMLKTAWLRANRFDTTYFLEDYPQWVKVVNEGKSLMYRPETSTYYRRLEQSFSARGRKDYYALRIRQDVIRCRMELMKDEQEVHRKFDELRDGIDIFQSDNLRLRRWLLATIRRHRGTGVLYYLACCTNRRYLLRFAWFLSRLLSAVGLKRI